MTITDRKKQLGRPKAARVVATGESGSGRSSCFRTGPLPGDGRRAHSKTPYLRGFTTSALPPPRRTGSAAASNSPRPRSWIAVASPG